MAVLYSPFWQIKPFQNGSDAGCKSHVSWRPTPSYQATIEWVPYPPWPEKQSLCFRVVIFYIFFSNFKSWLMTALFHLIIIEIFLCFCCAFHFFFLFCYYSITSWFCFNCPIYSLTFLINTRCFIFDISCINSFGVID